MSLGPTTRSTRVLPAIRAPMMLVSGPELVTAACKAGVMAALPRHDARDQAGFGGWLAAIRAELDAHRGVTGPLAVNALLARYDQEMA